MDEIGVDATKGRDRLQSGGNVLKRGGTGGAIIRIGVLDHVDGNGENSGGTHTGFMGKITGKRVWRSKCGKRWVLRLTRLS